MRPALLLAALLMAGCASPTPEHAPPTSPYVEEASREIKALSPDEIEGYRTGAGLGYAKSAELNHYPGPLHALQMADALALTDAQRRDIAEVRAQMLAEAVPLGERYLEAEAAIERAFRAGGIDAEALRALLEEAHAIEAQLRFVHLDAHLTTRALMTPEQVARYDELRGYNGGEGDNEHGH